jgi:hypothetical protein
MYTTYGSLTKESTKCNEEVASLVDAWCLTCLDSDDPQSKRATSMGNHLVLDSCDSIPRIIAVEAIKLVGTIEAGQSFTAVTLKDRDEIANARELMKSKKEGHESTIFLCGHRVPGTAGVNMILATDRKILRKRGARLAVDGASVNDNRISLGAPIVYNWEARRVGFTSRSATATATAAPTLGQAQREAQNDTNSNGDSNDGEKHVATASFGLGAGDRSNRLDRFFGRRHSR